MSKLKLFGKLNPVQYKQMLDHLTKKKIKNPFIDADDIVVNKKPEVEEREVINAFMRRNPRTEKAGGGMLVQPGFGGTRQGYRTAGAVPLESKGISLTKDQLNLLKEKLTPQEFRKLKFGQPRKADAYDVGVFQRYKATDPEVKSGVKKAGKKNRLFYKIQNILFPGKYETGSKIINNEKLTNKVIELTNKGKSADDITSVLMKSDKKINRNMVSSAINSLVRQNKLDDKYTVMGSTGYTKAEMAEVDNIIKKEVAKGELGRADIGRKAEIADSYVERWIRKNKGDKFYETNYTYEKGLLRKGTLQKQKDLFNYIETVDNISAAEVKKIFKMESGKATQKLMSDLVKQIYRMTGNSRTGSLVVPHNDEGRMRDVLGKIRNAPDFEDTYQRRIGSLVRDAYPKGSKAQTQAIESLNQYWKFSRALKKAAPELALNLDHVVPFGFLEEVKQGTNPINLIKVKPIPRALNLFKANFDIARIELNRLSKIDPNNPEVRKKFKLLRELENITPIEFGGISQKGNVFDFKAQPIGKSDLIKDAAKGVEQYQKVARFSQDVLGNKTLQKKFKDAGVIAGKNLAMFDRVKLLSTEQIKGLSAFMKEQGIECRLSKGANCNTLQAYIKSLNDLSVRSSQGDTEAASKLKNFTNKAATTGRFLKNALGPLAIASEFALEGGIALNKTLSEGIPFKQAFADSYINKYVFGPKLQIDKEAEIAKEMAKGEEFAMAERGRRMMIPQSVTADEQRLKQREEEMKALYPQYSDQQLINMLEGAGYDPQDVINQKTTTRITPAVTSTLTGLDQLRTAFQEQDALQRIADAGGIANLAGGGIAKLAGDSSGRPPESGPNSQGLQGLMKRVRNL